MTAPMESVYSVEPALDGAGPTSLDILSFLDTLVNSTEEQCFSARSRSTVLQGLPFGGVPTVLAINFILWLVSRPGGCRVHGAAGRTWGSGLEAQFAVSQPLGRMHPWETRNSRVLKETLLPHLMHAGDSLQPEDVWVHVMPCYYDLCGPSSCEVLPALSFDSVGQSLLCWYLGSQRYIW